MESRHFRPGPLFGLVLLMLVFPLSAGAAKSRFEVSPALDSYLADDDWSAFEEQIDQLVKKRRLDPVRDSLRARFAAIVQPALLEKLLADYDNGLGMVLFDGSHYREALACFERVQRACSLYDNPEANQANLVNRTLCHALLGDTSASLSLFRQVVDPMIRDRTIYDLIYGDPEVLVEEFYGTDRIRHLADSLIRTDTILAAGWFYLLGYVSFRNDDTAAARAALEQAHALFQRTGDPDGLFYTGLYRAENDAKTDPYSDTNDPRFLSLVLEMIRCDSIGETAEALRSWSKYTVGDPLEIRFDSLALAIFDRCAAAEPDRDVLRGRLQFDISINPEFLLEPAMKIELIRGYLTGPKAAADTLRSIAAQWNIMDLYVQTGQPDSVRKYFQTLWREMRRRHELRSLRDLVAVAQGIADPFLGLGPADRSLAILIDNVLRAESDTLVEPSLDSLRTAYRQALAAAPKSDIVLAHRFMSDFYRSQFLTEPDSAEFYFWKEYTARRDLGDTSGAADCIEQLAWLDGYDPFPYLDGVGRDLAGFGPQRSATLSISLADHLSRLARGSFTTADIILEPWGYRIPDPKDPRTAQISYYRDLISHLAGGETAMPDTSGQWTFVADDPGITRSVVDTVAAYLEELATYNNDQGTDQQVLDYADELRASAHLAWAGRLMQRAIKDYRESARTLEAVLAGQDPVMDPAHYSGTFLDLCRSYSALRDQDALLGAYETVHGRLTKRLYRDIPRYVRDDIFRYVSDAYKIRDSVMAGLVKFELLDFASRKIEWGGGGYGAGMGMDDGIPDLFGEFEKKMLKPEAIYVEGKEIERYIKPVTFSYIEVRPPDWTAGRLLRITRIGGDLSRICRADAGLAGRWDLLSALIFLNMDDLTAADSTMAAGVLPDTIDAWLSCVFDLERGIANRLMGDLAAAELILAPAFRSSLRIHTADLLTACLSGELGNVRFTLGDLAGAQAAYADAFTVVEEHPVWPLLNARLRLTSGNLGLVMGLASGDRTQIDSAVVAYYDALDWMGSYQELNTYLTARLDLGIARWLQGQTDTAAALVQDVIQDDARHGMRLDEAWARNVLGYFLVRAGSWTDAIAVLDTAGAIFRDLGDRYGLSNCLALSGAARRRAGQNDTAYLDLKESIELFERIRGELDQPDAARTFCEQGEDRYAEMVQLLMDQGRRTDALSYIERSRSSSLKDIFSGLAIESGNAAVDTDAVKLRQLSERSSNLEDELVRAKAMPGEGRDKQAIKVLTETLAQTQARLEEVLIDLELSSPEIYSLLAVKPQLFNEGRIRQMVPKGTAFLEYFPAEKSLYIFVFTRDTTMVRQVHVPRTELDSLVSAFRGIIDESAQSIAAGFGVAPVNDWQGNEVKSLKGVLTALYARLIQPVADDINSLENVIILPAGSLYYLPFHALACDNEGRLTFFLQEKSISYLSSSTLMDILVQRASGPVNLLAFGDPDGTLAAALDEVQKIAAVIPDHRILTLDQATESMVKTLPADYTIVHLATHARLDPINPKSSHIVFAPDKAAGEDGRLEFGEILRLPLKDRTELVTLSACQTGIGKNPTGGEVMSLTRAFAAAGTPSILSTLWPVEDEATRGLMVHFYGRIKESDKAAALRSAQLALLSDPRTAHPFFWAPFILIGDRH